MKNLPSLLNRAVLAIAGALALGACSRGQYAMLPKAPAYLGSAPVAATAPRPAVAPAPRAAALPASPVAVAPAATQVPATSPASQPAAKLVATAPVARPMASTVAPAAPVDAEVASAPAKMNLVQRLALKKLTKKLDKLASQAPQLKQRDAAAGTNRLDSGLRTALVVLLIGVILAAFSGVSSVFGVIGAIFVIVGLVLLLLYLLDQA